MRKFIPPLSLILFILVVYLLTLAPGLTWSHDGADGGDLISAAATNGVAHPSGYPVYLVLAKFFQLWPVGSLAFRTNLLSALAATAATFLLYGILVWLPASPVQGNWLAGWIAAGLFGISPLVWSQAVITEVYTLHAAFVTLVFFLALSFPSSPKRHNFLQGLVLGLAAANHLTSLFMLPIVFISSFWKKTFRDIDGTSIRLFIGAFGLGLSAYALLPLRASTLPPVNWGNPTTLGRWVWLVTGQLYQNRLLDLTLAGFLQRAQSYLGLLLEQFDLPGMTLALIGVIFFFKPSRLYFITIASAVLSFLFAAVYNSFDAYVYLLPILVSMAIWIGIATGGLMRWGSTRKRVTEFATLAVTVVFGLMLLLQRWPQMDASRDTRAEDFGAQAMQLIPPDGLVFADGDRAIFTLWYFHYALRQRPDVVIVATDLLYYDWYLDTLRATYPTLVIEGDVVWSGSLVSQNLARPVCVLDDRDLEAVLCAP